MIEIFSLIYLSRKMGDLAIQKGEKVRTWKIYTVLAWFLSEFFGIVIGFIFFGQKTLFAPILLGLGCAVSSYFILKSFLEKKQDIDYDAEIESIGNNEND